MKEDIYEIIVSIIFWYHKKKKKYSTTNKGITKTTNLGQFWKNGSNWMLKFVSASGILLLHPELHLLLPQITSMPSILHYRVKFI